MGEMKNFRAQDMPGSKMVAYAQGNKPGDSESPSTSDQPQQNQGSNEVPEGTAKEVMSWVGDDAERAQRALDAEQSSGDPRSTLVEDLERVIRRDDESEVQNEQEQPQA